MSGTDTGPASGSGPRPVLILNTGSSTFKWALLSDDEKFLGTGSEPWEGADALTRKTQIVAKLHSLPPCRAAWPVPPPPRRHRSASWSSRRAETSRGSIRT